MGDVIYMDVTKRQEQRIIDQGRAAFFMGTRLDQCSYSTDSKERHLWEQGWWESLADNLATIGIETKPYPGNLRMLLNSPSSDVFSFPSDSSPEQEGRRV